MDDQFSFEKLIVYQKALNFIDKIYSVTKQFPKEEIYALTSQFKRAGYSVALNIGEGSGGTKLEFINFLRIGRRSVNECIVCITVAKRQQFINQKIENELRKDCAELSKMIAGLIKSLNDKK